MMNFSEYLTVKPLINFFHIYPYSAGIITYIIVLLETVAVIGVVFPGAIIMPAIGFLIGSNIVPAGSTFLCAIVGAITGDYISYFIGIYFQERIHRIWPFTKWPNLLQQGEKYFAVHGGKSVFIGRFVFVIRTVIPLIAGVLKMPLLRFSVAAIPSALLWSIGYMLPGVLLGALSLELPSKIAAEFSLWVFLLIVGVWLVVWFLHHFFKQIWRMLDYYITCIWKYCRGHKTLSWFSTMLSDPRQPNNHQQLTLAIAVIITFFLFFFTCYQVMVSGFLTKLDAPVYYLLRNLRTKSLDYIFVVITLLGDSIMLAIASGVFLLWLVWKRYWYIAVHWFAVMLLCVAVVGGAKFLLFLPRPGEVLYEKYSATFPSAHTALSLAFYGFLAVIIARESKQQRNLMPYCTVSILVALIAFSRLYLGVHWLTDVLGSFLLGLAVVLLLTISYRRQHHFHFPARKIFLIVTGIFTVVWLSCSAIKFHQQVMVKYSLLWPQQVVELNQLPGAAPLYRLNRLGHVIEAFNVEWLGNLETIKQDLLKQGWKVQPQRATFLDIVRGFFSSAAVYHLPMFPQLYHNRPPALLLVKKLSQNNVLLVLHLWSSDLKIKGIDLPLWLGVVKYYQAASKEFSLHKFKDDPVFAGATGILTKYLKDFSWRQVVYVLGQQPEEMRKLHWDGKILIIKPRK